MTGIVRSLAEELCNGRVLFVLEGGYAASSLIDGTRAVVDVMSSENPEKVNEIGHLEPGFPLRSIVERVASVHARHWPGIGSP